MWRVCEGSRASSVRGDDASVGATVRLGWVCKLGCRVVEVAFSPGWMEQVLLTERFMLSIMVRSAGGMGGA